MSHKRKPRIEWTYQLDQALSILHENGYTWSGIAQELGGTRLDVMERAGFLGLRLFSGSNSRQAVAKARDDRQQMGA